MKTIVTKDIYNKYIGKLIASIDTISNNIAVLNKHANFPYGKIRKGVVELINLQGLDAEFLINLIRSPNYLEAKSYVENFEFVNNDSCRITKDKLLNYVTLVCNYRTEIRKLKMERKNLKSKLMSYSVFKQIIKEINLNISQFILEGNIFKFSGGLGPFYINRKKQYYSSSDSSEYAKKVVDYGATNKCKEDIAKKCAPEIYKKYKNNEITRAEFNTLMKPHLQGKDYVVLITNNYNNWWWWGKKHCFIKNKSIYVFHPTNGMNAKNENGKVVKFNSLKSKITSLNDIKYLSIGNIYKLTLATTVDPTLNERYKELSHGI